MKGKFLLSFILLSSIFTLMGFVIWKTEYQYLLPTPKPKNYQAVPLGQIISTQTYWQKSNQRASFFHFFNPDCPCSRFNLQHFQKLLKSYSYQIDFYAVIAQEDYAEKTQKLLQDNGITIPIIVDEKEELAKKCGVYSTPQAVLIDKDFRLYYRGNYNKFRYCTDEKSNYAQMALQALIKNEEPPVFSAFATEAYGCPYVQE